MYDKRGPSARIKGLAFATALITLVISLSVVSMPFTSASNLSIGGASDCDDNAIIRCGAHSVNGLIEAYRDSAYVRAVYSDFGISAGDMDNLSNTVEQGSVTRQGDVFVDGRLVARQAVTGGRQDMPGSTKVDVNGAIFFKRPPSVSFVSSPLPAFVSMINGRFDFAVLSSCGNAVAAVPVTPPKTAVAPARPVTKTPQPTPPSPAPTQTQTQTQTQQVSQNQQVTVENQTPAATTTSTAAPSEQPAEAQVSATTTPAPTLPNTGPGDVFGLFSASGLVGFLGYRRFLLHKISR